MDKLDIYRLERVKTLVGLRYVYLGRLGELPKSSSDVLRLNREGHGIDCYGMNLLIYRFLGYDLKDYVYKDGWHKNGENYFVEEYPKYCRRVKNLELWDGILFRIKSRVPNHAGVYIGDGKFIHCKEDASVMIDSIHGPWENHIFCYLRFKDECRERKC